MKRMNANKQQSAKRFNQHQQKTKKINLAPPPMRGGIRL
ncbi:MAG: hypothetical protein [Microvirus sp.]|nr:MAG: hypothetical protein [Microvirus sp.]